MKIYDRAFLVGYLVEKFPETKFIIFPPCCYFFSKFS